MKAIRKRVKPPPLSYIIKQNQNDSDRSISSTESSNVSSSSGVIQSNISQLPVECQENSIKTYNSNKTAAAVLNEWEEDHPEKKQQKTLFEKRRSQKNSNVARQKINVSPNSRQIIAQDLNLSSINQNNNCINEIESTSFQLQELNPKPQYQSSTSLLSQTCSISSTATKSTLLSQNLQIPSSQLLLLAKIMEEIEKNGKDVELYPALPKNNNR